MRHFLLFLTPLQDLWENLPKNKNSKGTSVLFKVPCGFDLVGWTFLLKCQKIEENDKRLLQSGFLKSDSPKIIRKTPLPAKNTTSQTFTTPFFLLGTAFKHTANYCTHQKPVLPQSFPLELSGHYFPQKQKEEVPHWAEQLPKINK